MIKDKQTIREFSGKIIGYIETDERGNKTVRDFYGKILGRYEKGTDTTRDFYGKILARGDQSSMLLRWLYSTEIILYEKLFKKNIW